MYKQLSVTAKSPVDSKKVPGGGSQHNNNSYCGGSGDPEPRVESVLTQAPTPSLESTSIWFYPLLSIYIIIISPPVTRITQFPEIRANPPTSIYFYLLLWMGPLTVH